MNKFTKFVNKMRGADYLNKLDPALLKDTYLNLSAFYDDQSIPFINAGLAGEVQFKIRYNEARKSIQIAWECSSPNRTQTKIKLSIDWLVNFLAWPSWVFKTKLFHGRQLLNGFGSHAGYSLCFNNVYNRLNLEINNLTRKDVRAFEVFGWSYGGAMAQLTHRMLRLKFGEEANITTITIGSPRPIFKIPFSPFFRKWRNLKKSFRNLFMFQNRNDLITGVPFLFMLYRHVLPGIKVGDRFSLLKIFRPDIYHEKKEYDKVIVEKLDNMK